MQDSMNRRGFLALGAAACLPGKAEVREYRRGGMVYRRLGRTGVFVSLLGYGSHTDYRYRLRAPWGSVLNEEGQRRRDRQISRAIDLGVSMIDVYQDCGQWEPMAQLARGRRDRLVLSLKKEFPGPTADVIDNGCRLFGYMDLFRFVIYDTKELTQRTIERWDVVRKAKEAGKIRAIGIATHDPDIMVRAIRELEGLDFIFFPYNFIHDRVAYSEFLPLAVKHEIGLLAMKPLGTGSITKLDSRRPRPDAKPEGETLALNLGNLRERTPMLAEAVTALTQELDRAPEETLAQAALRFLFSKPYLTCALPGMWLDEEVEENYLALATYASGRAASTGVIKAASAVASAAGPSWLPAEYRWLDRRWRRSES